jgi:hypothetical protein
VAGLNPPQQIPSAPSLDRQFRSARRDGAKHRFRPGIANAAPRRKRKVILPMGRMVHVERRGLSNADATTSTGYQAGPNAAAKTKGDRP